MSTRKQQTARSNSGADADELRCELQDLRAELQALKTQKQTLRQTDTEEHPARHGGTSTSSYIWMEGFLLLTVCNIVFYAWANNFVDGLLGIERISAHPTAAAGKIDFGPVVMLLPLLGLMYQDLQHNASKKFFTAVPDRIMNYVLRVVGGYGIVQVLAQDLGVTSGINQRNIVQHPVMLFFMLWGGAFALTTFRSEGMVAALLYFVLKYNVSGGLTSQVCFEDV